MSGPQRKRFVVVTSIRECTAAVKAFAAREDWRVVFVGDRKGPKTITDERIEFLDIERQRRLDFEYVRHCPENHYARKNIGYLHAIAQGAEVIAETDDDNFPGPDWGRSVDFDPHDVERAAGLRTFNVYRAFTEAPVWPRGFPLAEIRAAQSPQWSRGPAKVGVWQELADDDPDVDAIFRLTRPERVRFVRRERLALGPHVYCPFNSQNTFWSPAAYPCLYLPGTVTSRYCDILRGYVAQRLFWERQLLLGFGPASVRQERNEHDLMRDFQDELSMYLTVPRVLDLLERLAVTDAPTRELPRIHAALAQAGIVAGAEEAAVRSWCADLERLGVR
ncbi:MAG TPA: hypothetical protein VG710_09780 [Opitutus sp.]|nr:hypothetical protein [Opitutus sp.]